MTDSAPTPQAAPAPAGVSLPITILTQYVRDFSFENPLAPASLIQTGQPPQLQMNVTVQTRRLAEDRFEVVLLLRADAKIGEHTAFLIELAYGGLIALGQELPENILKPLLLVEVPKLLFPFVRQLVADAVQAGGYAPLFIHPVDFADMYRQQHSQAAA